MQHAGSWAVHSCAMRRGPPLGAAFPAASHPPEAQGKRLLRSCRASARRQRGQHREGLAAEDGGITLCHRLGWRRPGRAQQRPEVAAEGGLQTDACNVEQGRAGLKKSAARCRAGAWPACMQGLPPIHLSAGRTGGWPSAAPRRLWRSRTGGQRLPGQARCRAGEAGHHPYFEGHRAGGRLAASAAAAASAPSPSTLHTYWVAGSPPRPTSASCSPSWHARSSLVTQLRRAGRRTGFRRSMRRRCPQGGS